MDKDIDLSPMNDSPSVEQPVEISRRNVLVGTAAAAAATGLVIDPALALQKKAAANASASANMQSAMQSMDAMGATPEAVPVHAANLKKFHQNFLEPQVISSTREGVLEQNLNVGFSEVTITTFDSNGNPVPRTQCVRCYNGSVPGTTFRVFPGDRLAFTVNNQLPKNQPAPPPGQNYNCEQLADNNFPGCFNTTNLHLHGLHVSPKTGADGVSSDDVMVRIPPVGDTMDTSGEPSTRKYCVQLPTFHAPGTHWYHAHIHGATGIQLVNGLAGAIIVEEPEDQKISADKEVIWMVQEVIGGSYAPGTCDHHPDELYMSGAAVYSNTAVSATDGTKPYGSVAPQGVGFTVNSLSSPTLKMQPNEIQRWRVIDGTATPRGIFNFVLKDASGTDVSQYLYLIAVDGITFYGHSPQRVGSGGWVLAPGNRADFLVSIPTPGIYKVWRMKNGTSPGDDQILAIIEVTGPSMPQRDVSKIPLPGWDKAPCYLQPIMDNEINEDPLKFDLDVVGGYFGGFVINGKPYGNSSGIPPNVTVKLGDVRRTLLASGGKHPYHIHVNPFQVEGDKIDPNGPNDPSNWRWWDTILIPGKPVNTRSRYLNYDGMFVFHCHILVHEDFGMMSNFTVEADPANGYPPVAPCTPVTKCQKGRPPKQT